MKKYTIATVVKRANDRVWFERMRKGIQKFSQETGHRTFLVGPPRMDERLQVQVIESALTEGVDAVCVVPFFPQALELVLFNARAQGIVVISHEAPNLRNIDYDLEAFDNAVFGAHLMKHLASYMGAEGEYAILLGSLTTRSHAEWARAVVAWQTEKYPHLNLMSKKIEVLGDPALARQKAEELIAAYPNLKGILGISTTATRVAGAVIEERKLQQRIALVGTGLVSECRPHLLSGAAKMICFWDPADAGYVMNKLAVLALERKTIPAGFDFGAPGYNQIQIDRKVLIGSAMVAVTKETMARYPFGSGVQ